MSARILTITGAAHPKAEVQSIDEAAGLCIFRWLDTNESPVDSGGSVATFEPLEPDVDGVYPAVSDEELIVAIAAA